MTTFFWITGVVLFIFLAAMVYMAAGLVKLVYVQTLYDIKNDVPNSLLETMGDKGTKVIHRWVKQYLRTFGYAYKMGGLTPRGESKYKRYFP